MNYYLTKYDIDLPVILLNLEYLERPEDHLFQENPGCLNIKGLLYKKMIIINIPGGPDKPGLPSIPGNPGEPGRPGKPF